MTTKMELNAFRKMSYGIYLVASEWHHKKVAYIANTVFQVTADPPQLAISCHKDNESTGIIRDAGIFSVSVIQKNTTVDFIGDFGYKSGREFDKFKGRNWDTACTGAPIIIDDAVAWFDCKVKQWIDLGSHWLAIGEVFESKLLEDKEPLTYSDYQKEFKLFSPEHSPTYIKKSLSDENKTNIKSEAKENISYVCAICGFTYNPEEGDPSAEIPPGTAFEDLPEDYRCPVCNANKDYFKKI